MTRRFALPAALVCALAGLSAQEPDAEGCQDHPLLTRMPGYRIHRCTRHDFGSHAFAAGPGRQATVEGKYTEILYGLQEGAKEPSRLQLQRNYEQAVARIGGKVLHRDDDGNVTLRLTQDGREVWILLNAYITSQYSLTVVEKAAMEQEVTATAEALGGRLASEGRVAVQGILFDTGKAELKPESLAALQEVGRLLKLQPRLKLHVVGHTDNQAGLDLNLKLSQARAEAVVQALVKAHGIDASRLAAHGLGPLAPVAPNKDEAGRARNRRVEIVPQ